MRKIISIMSCIIVIGAVVNAKADVSECTEEWINAPGSTKARVCAVQEVEKLEKGMDNLVKDIIAELRKCPKCSEIQNEDVFLKAQKAWKQYRDTNCLLEYQSSAIMTPLYLCEARLTENRIQVLKGYLACREGNSDMCDPWPVSSSVSSCKTKNKKINQ